MIEPIINQNFGNIFQHHNGLNKCQHIHKNTSQQYQQKNTSQHYQPRSHQRPRTSSIPYLKEDCLPVEFGEGGVKGQRWEFSVNVVGDGG